MPSLVNATAKVAYTYDELIADAGVSDVSVTAVNHNTTDNRMTLTVANSTPPADTPGVSDPDAISAVYSWTGDDLASLAGLVWGDTAIVTVDFDTSTDPVAGVVVDLAKA